MQHWENESDVCWTGQSGQNYGYARSRSTRDFPQLTQGRRQSIAMDESLMEILINLQLSDERLASALGILVCSANLEMN